MRAGSLDERITILQRAVVIDDHGAERETWSDLLSVWSDWLELGSREAVRNPQIMGELDAVVTIRTPSRSINSTMRLRRSGDRLYEIRGINALPRRGEGYEIQARSLDKTMATVA